jgi:hypothetical protein
LICVSACLETAYGAANEGGTLIVALSEGTYFTIEDPDYCDNVTATSCETAVTNAPSVEDGGPTPIINVLAAFPPPGGRLSGIVWGVDYDPDRTFIVSWEACGDFELANSDWPAPFSGTAVTWFNPQTDPLVSVYWFAAYGYDGQSFNLGPHPSQGGQFADDSVPAEVDDIAGFGSFGFGSNPGFNVCPVAGDPEGACCFDGGSCAITTEADCETAGGVYQGADTVCDPNPCGPTPTVERSWGEIKNQHR